MKPWLFLPSSFIHFLSPWFLKVYSRIKASKPQKWNSFHWRHLYFPNPLGTAGGVDKNATLLKEWWRLGAGFLEIGTCTPEPQKANPGKILDRSVRYLSLWNNMGFPNKGMEFVKKQLLDLPENKPSPIFISLGKNRATPFSQSIEDYQKALKALYPFADVFVINISSPNTEGLRDVFSKNQLPDFLRTLKGIVMNLNPKIPIILKISPDETKLLRILEQSIEAEIDGWCICNTTKERSVLDLFPLHGGVSGKLLAPKSLSLLKQTVKYLKEKNIHDKLIISCGGAFTLDDILERLKYGAHLIQVYSALVFEGPNFFQSIFKAVSQKRKEMDGF